MNNLREFLPAAVVNIDRNKLGLVKGYHYRYYINLL